MGNCDDAAPPPPTSPALARYWNRCVHELATVTPPALGDLERERHRIFMLLTMALVHRYWNGNKNGAEGIYPWRAGQRLSGDDQTAGIYRGAARRDKSGFDFDYLGHNIAAVAVDGIGNVIDFEFNHNEILDSSVEHAESRLIRRVFSLAQVERGWALESADVQEDKKAGREYATTLNDVTVYTSLEPCAQCAGIMALAQVKTLVYLQTDPGMYGIGNILYNFTNGDGSRLRAPLPVHSALAGLTYGRDLEQRFSEFEAGVGERKLSKLPVFQRNAGAPEVTSPSITSFLCTDRAWEIFGHARTTFAALDRAALITLADGTTPNHGVLRNALRFHNYAVLAGERGTPHKL